MQAVVLLASAKSQNIPAGLAARSADCKPKLPTADLAVDLDPSSAAVVGGRERIATR